MPAASQPAICALGLGSVTARGRETNAELAARHGLGPGWIERRCGVEHRHIANGETATTLGAAAARLALQRCLAPPDLVLCATFSPDRLLAPIAPRIAAMAGLGPVAAYDLNGACSGGLLGFLAAWAHIASGMFRSILVVATDTTTKHIAPDDLRTRVLFSDGAAAVHFAAAPAAGSAVRFRVLAHCAGSNAAGSDCFYAAWDAEANGRCRIRMDGRTLFRFAVRAGVETLGELCRLGGISPASLDRVLVHQANGRINAAICDAFPTVPPARWPSAIREGNFASASLPRLFVQEFSDHPPARGQRAALVAFGAGLSWAGALLQVD